MRPLKRVCHFVVRIDAVLCSVNNARLITVAAKERHQFVITHSAKNSRCRNLITVEVKNRQYYAIFARVKQLIEMPSASRRPGLGFAVTNQTSYRQIRIIHRRTITSAERVTKFTALENHARRLGIRMTRKTVRPAKFAAQFANTIQVSLHRRIKISKRTFQKQISLQCWEAMPRPQYKHHVLIMLLGRVAEMRVSKVNTWPASPVSENPRFDIVKS